MKNAHLFQKNLRQVLLLTRVWQPNAVIIEKKNWSHQSFQSAEENLL